MFRLRFRQADEHIPAGYVERTRFSTPCAILRLTGEAEVDYAFGAVCASNCAYMRKSDFDVICANECFKGFADGKRFYKRRDHVTRDVISARRCLQARDFATFSYRCAVFNNAPLTICVQMHFAELPLGAIRPQ